MVESHQGKTCLYDRSASGRLHYNYFRDFDPAIGRYIESDPIGLDGGINTYSYAFNRPLFLSDPTGEFAIPAGVVAVEGLINTAGAILIIASANSAKQPSPQSGTSPSGDTANNSNNGSKKCESCDKDYPMYVKCSVLVDYPYWSMRPALDALGGGRLHNQDVAKSGPCSIDTQYIPGKHWNVRRGSQRQGSIVMCPCCDDQSGGAKLREKYRAIP